MQIQSKKYSKTQANVQANGNASILTQVLNMQDQSLQNSK
jgi:hypothetical protein